MLAFPLLFGLLLRLSTPVNGAPVDATASSLTTRSGTCPYSNIIGEYWPNWEGAVQTPDQINYGALNLVYYFVIPTTNSSDGFAPPNGQSLWDLQSLCNNAHAQGKRALISTGGWDGSVWFSQMMSTSTRRQNFVKAITAFVVKYNYDGLDIDWEGPNSRGAGNLVSPNDAANFLLLLPLLRTAFGPNKLLTAAVPTAGFIGPDGYTPISDSSGFARYLDYITIMNYDIYGPWSSTTGPNAPFGNIPGQTTAPGAVYAWTSTGFPKCQILLGVAAYSHQFLTAVKGLQPKTYNGVTTYLFQKVAAKQPGDPVYTYNQLVTMGYLTSNGRAGANGWYRHWDQITSTPFLYSISQGLLISYEDAHSIGVKSQWVNSMGMAGVVFYDSTGPSQQMLNVARVGLAGKYVAPGELPRRMKRGVVGDVEVDIEEEEAVFDA